MIFMRDNVGIVAVNFNFIAIEYMCMCKLSIPIDIGWCKKCKAKKAIMIYICYLGKMVSLIPFHSLETIRLWRFLLLLSFNFQ